MSPRIWNKKLTPEIEQLIINKYQAGMRAREILSLIPFKTRKTVYDVLEKHAIPRRDGISAYKHYNEAIFANIDTAAKAYWLGILITDGYVIDTRRDCEPQIGLQMTDQELLEKFRSFLGSKNPVMSISKRSDKRQKMYRVVIYSRRMAKDLSQYGVVARKTYSTYLPILVPQLMPHLIRGICEVSHRADSGLIIGFCGSERLVVELRMWLICSLGISENRVHKNGTICFVQWSNQTDIKKIVRYLYSDAEVYLDRKFALVKPYLEMVCQD